ncbi:MAG: hypothetical protein M9962_05815 [Oligoflexia bacterium]|nr:hypothetical protein [Oligoflexia bacterium]
MKKISIVLSLFSLFISYSLGLLINQNHITNNVEILGSDEPSVPNKEISDNR